MQKVRLFTDRLSILGFTSLIVAIFLGILAANTVDRGPDPAYSAAMTNAMTISAIVLGTIGLFAMFLAAVFRGPEQDRINLRIKEFNLRIQEIEQTNNPAK